MGRANRIGDTKVYKVRRDTDVRGTRWLGLPGHWGEFGKPGRLCGVNEGQMQLGWLRPSEHHAGTETRERWDEWGHIAGVEAFASGSQPRICVVGT